MWELRRGHSVWFFYKGQLVRSDFPSTMDVLRQVSLDVLRQHRKNARPKGRP